MTMRRVLLIVVLAFLGGAWKCPSGNHHSCALVWQSGGGVVSGYQVWRGTVSGQETPLVTVTATNYTDTAVVAGTTYYYVVYAVAQDGVTLSKTSTKEVSGTP